MPSKKPTQRRRANGEGSIWWDANRQRYVGQISVRDDATGKPKRRTVFARTQDELQRRLTALRASADATIDRPDHLTVARFLAHWVHEVLPISGKRPNTIRNYSEVVRLYINPSIGNLELADMKPRHVDSMTARLQGLGYAPSTVAKARKTLGFALKIAVRDGLVDRNVAAQSEAVAVPRQSRSTLTPDEAGRLIATAKAQGHGALVAVMLGLGLRRQEVLGLRWCEVDFDAGTLTVNGVIARGVDGGQEFSEITKTSSSRRRLHLPAAVTGLLRQHRVDQARQKIACVGTWGRDWPHDDFVFTTSVGTPLDLMKATRLITALAADAGLGRWTPHGLRHSAASILLAEGVQLKEISETLGHSSILVTADIYTHLMEPARRSVADAMQAAIFGG
jgi:integrase